MCIEGRRYYADDVRTRVRAKALQGLRRGIWRAVGDELGIRPSYGHKLHAFWRSSEGVTAPDMHPVDYYRTMEWGSMMTVSQDQAEAQDEES